MFRKKTSPKKTVRRKKRQPTLASPKGMRDILHEEFFIYQGFFEKAADIALYYGFQPIETPILEKEEVFTRGVGTDTDIVAKEMYAFSTKGRDRLAMRPEGTAGVMRAYIEHGMFSRSQPVMLYYHGPFFRHERPQRDRARQFWQFGFEILGTDQSITDALTIKLTYLILEEMGIKGLCVLINSIGDSQCRPEYIKELNTYYRKHINKLCVHCKKRLRQNPLRLLDCKDKQCQEFKEDAPDMISFLCEPCKRHLKDVLEHLDAMNIDYEIDHTLVRGLDYYTRTVFEIVSIPEKEDGKADDDGKSENEEKKDDESESKKKEEKKVEETLSLGSGGRYDELAHTLGSRRDIPAIGAAIGVDRAIKAPGFLAPQPRIIKKPKAYFIQIGVGAKFKSFEVIEALRKARIPITHAISKDTLSAQLGMAEKAKITHIVILGQKEANENSVIVRNMNTRSQETVQISKLGDYLKKRS
tara:strand:- start:11085 stop:12497 length:1413 start_codon:yes stop_codon:yes gene_type:complete